MTTVEYNGLIDTFSDRLFRYALKLTYEHHWSEDLVQDSLAKLWLHKEKMTIEHAQSFLYRVLYNKMIDDSRKKKRTQLPGSLPEKATTVTTEIEHKDLLEQAFTRLDDRQRQIIMLRDWQGYSYKEIGEIMEYKESLVKVLIFRARKKMRNIINELNTTH